MPVSTSIWDGILVATVSNPPVNALGQAEREGLLQAARTADQGDVRALVIIGSGQGFIAGADIREFGVSPQPPYLPDVLKEIEQCSKPVLAAISGNALGGGLEVALACHYRIGSADASLGLPEVTLGVVPGAGGTQRLPRLIDPVMAATMITSGKPIPAEEALACGLIDRIATTDLLTSALAYAAEVAGADFSQRRLSARSVSLGKGSAEALETMAASLQRRSRGAEAPVCALELVRAACSTPFDEGLAAERQTFLRLRAGPQAKALRHIFFAERSAGKAPEGMRDVVPRKIAGVGVVGAGTMGTGIALSFIEHGLPVTLVDCSAEALGRGMVRVAESLQSSVKQGRISQDDATHREGLLNGTTSYDDLAHCQLIVEAAFEAMEVKREVFQQLDRVAAKGAVLATNTSYLDLDEIAASTSRPADVVGMHFFSPANIMRLLEIVQGSETSPDTLLTALAVAKRIGKTPVIARASSGFIGNRMLKAYVREAGLLLLEGATPDQVDAALTAFGMAMGPFAVADLSGIDVAYKARKALPEGSYEPLATIVHDRLVESGHLGRKSGSGFYSYSTPGRPAVNPAVIDIIELERRLAGIKPRALDETEIVDRCMLALANEGGFVLEEGVARQPSDIDVVYVNGYGFPRHLGGPMFHASQRGGQFVRERISSFAKGRFGYLWRISPAFAEEN